MEYKEIPKEIQDLAEGVIEAQDRSLLSSPWKSSPEDPYAIRRFNPQSSEDTQAYTDMDRHPGVLKWMLPPEPSTSEDIDYVLNTDESNPDDPRLLWAVVDEKNDPLGWVQFVEDGLLDGERKNTLGIPEDALLLEISYCKYFNRWPKYSRFIVDRENLEIGDNPGVAVKGVKQTLLLLRQMESRISSESGVTPRRIFVSGYTNPENVASEKVLAANGFENKGKIEYEGETDNVWLREI